MTHNVYNSYFNIINNVRNMSVAVVEVDCLETFKLTMSIRTNLR